MIPQQLQLDGIKFVLLEKSGKKPFQQSWQLKDIAYNNGELLNHLIAGGNYGVRGGGEKNLLIVDFDNEKIQKEVMEKLPETFTVKTGRGLLHKYFYSDSKESFKIFDEEMNTLLDVQGEGKQVVGPGSTHPNGNKYEVIQDIDIASISYAELKAIIIPYDKKPVKHIKTLEHHKEYSHDNFLDLVTSTINMEKVLSNFGVNTSRNPTNCPLHSSKGGKCLSWDREVAHCFHCQNDGEGWNIFSFIKQIKSCDFKEALYILVNLGGLQKEHEENKKRYIEQQKQSETNVKKQ